MPPWIGLPLTFVIGACIGSFLNVCIYRLPLEKSLLWPNSRCGRCFQPIRWQDNIPLVSYWLLGGRCRTCGEGFSIRYFWVELTTALSFAGLYYLEVVQNVCGFDERLLGPDRFDAACWCTFSYHALLLSFLLTAAVCDLDSQHIPFSLTVTGTIVGLIGAVIFPWPWPYTPAEALPGIPAGVAWLNPHNPPITGLYAWPVWGPLPAWLRPGGNWQTGLATGLAGVFVGTFMMRAVRFFFGLGLGSEYADAPDPAMSQVPSWPGSKLLAWLQGVGGKALGLGDADLMMMAGAFLGWQAVVVAFFVGVIPGLFFGLAQLVLRGNQALPFAPALGIGVVMTFLGWPWIGPRIQPVFFEGTIMITLVVFCCVTMLGLSYGLRLLRLIRHA